MVNLTESFTKLYGRAPSESEIAQMMKLKAEQDARKNSMIKPKRDIAALSKQSKELHETKTKPKPKPRAPTQINDKSLMQWPKRAPQMALRINRMLKDEIPIATISYYLGIGVNFVNAEIVKWRLPREKDR